MVNRRDLVHHAHVVDVRNGSQDTARPVARHGEGQLRLALDKGVEVDRCSLHGKDAAVLGGAEDADDVWMQPDLLDVGDLVLHRLQNICIGDIGVGAVRPRADAHFGFGADDFEGDIAVGGELPCLVDGGEGALANQGTDLIFDTSFISSSLLGCIEARKRNEILDTPRNRIVGSFQE
jgi:hypothetical protein